MDRMPGFESFRVREKEPASKFIFRRVAPVYKALVIEDEPNVRKELVLFSPWSAAGVLLSGDAGDGAEGLSLIVKVKPDIVLTDIRMPGIDGLAMIKQVKQLCRKDTAFREPEWIILSGYSSMHELPCRWEYRNIS